MNIEANTGGPAFPTGIGLNANKTWIGSGSDGMTLRDYFAAKAMQGYAQREDVSKAIALGRITPEEIWASCYIWADGMLSARGTVKAREL